MFSVVLVFLTARWNKNTISHAHPQGPNGPSPSGQPYQGPGSYPSHGHGGYGGSYGGGGGIQSSISPAYTWLFEYPLPIPPTAQPTYSDTINGTKIDYYEITLGDYSHQAYPNLAQTQLVAYSEYIHTPE